MTHALGLAAATFVLRGFINGRKIKNQTLLQLCLSLAKNYYYILYACCCMRHQQAFDLAVGGSLLGEQSFFQAACMHEILRAFGSFLDDEYITL